MRQQWDETEERCFHRQLRSIEKDTHDKGKKEKVAIGIGVGSYVLDTTLEL